MNSSFLRRLRGHPKIRPFTPMPPKDRDNAKLCCGDQRDKQS
jgi:hypothetical protein